MDFTVNFFTISNLVPSQIDVNSRQKVPRTIFQMRETSRVPQRMYNRLSHNVENEPGL